MSVSQYPLQYHKYFAIHVKINSYYIKGMRTVRSRETSDNAIPVTLLHPP